MDESMPKPAPVGEPQVPPVVPAAESAPLPDQRPALEVGSRAVGAVTARTVEVPRFRPNSPFVEQQTPYRGQHGPSGIPAAPGSHGTVVFGKPGGGHISYQK